MKGIENLKLTEQVRYCLAKMQGTDCAERRVIEYLYTINLIDDQPRANKTMQAMSTVVKAVAKDIQADMAGMVRDLSVEWTYYSTVVTNLQKKGIAIRRSEGKHRYVSMPYNLTRQIYRALQTGEIIPANKLDG